MSDSVSRKKMLMAGIAVLFCANILLALGSHWGLMLCGIAMWGLHLGITQGLLTTMIASTAPADLKGTAFGFFNLVSGGAMLAASVTAGVLWQKMGPAYTFWAGAVISAATFAAVLVYINKNQKEI